MVLAEALLRVPDARYRRPLHRRQARPRRLRAPRNQIQRVPGQCVGLGARRVGARDPARRNAARHARPAGQTAGPAGGARRHTAGDAADGQSFRARRDHRGGAGAGAVAPDTRRATPSTCSAKAPAPRPTRTRYFNSYASAIEAIGRAADNRPLPDRPGISVKLSALHPRYEAVSRAARHGGTGAAADRSGAPGQGPRPQFHRRCRGSRPAGTVAGRDRRRLWRRVAGRMGRLWARDPGLPEARRAR